MAIPAPTLWRLSFAVTFRDRETDQDFECEQNIFERVGNCLRWGVGSAADLILREFRNPILIVALTAIAMVIATIIFYPEITIGLVAKVFPWILAIKPWMIKMAIYIAVESTVLGVGLRTFGHLQNTPLIERWNRGELEPVYVRDRRR